MKNKRHYYTQEQDQFLINNVKGITLKDLTNKFNKQFKLSLSESAISNRKVKLKIKSEIVGGQFQKGQISWNKGKKWDEYMSKEGQAKSRLTSFKKGNIPHNHRELFEERLDKNGYIEIKIKEPNTWQVKQRYIYEQHNGSIPEGHKVIFADGNKFNFDIDNLILVSNAQEFIMNQNKLRTHNKELTKTGCLIAKVIDKNNKLRKK